MGLCSGENRSRNFGVVGYSFICFWGIPVKIRLLFCSGFSCANPLPFPNERWHTQPRQGRLMRGFILPQIFCRAAAATATASNTNQASPSRFPRRFPIVEAATQLSSERACVADFSPNCPRPIQTIGRLGRKKLVSGIGE